MGVSYAVASTSMNELDVLYRATQSPFHRPWNHVFIRGAGSLCRPCVSRSLSLTHRADLNTTIALSMCFVGHLMSNAAFYRDSSSFFITIFTPPPVACFDVHGSRWWGGGTCWPSTGQWNRQSGCTSARRGSGGGDNCGSTPIMACLAHAACGWRAHCSGDRRAVCCDSSGSGSGGDVGDCCGGVGGDGGGGGGRAVGMASYKVTPSRAKSTRQCAVWVAVMMLTTLLVLSTCSAVSAAPSWSSNTSGGRGRGGVRCPSRPDGLRRLARNAFWFGYNNYLKHAFPLDELDPIHCCGRGE